MIILISCIHFPSTGNKGKSTKGVNFDTLGCWNSRIKLPILLDQSIKQGKIIPKVPLDEVAQASVIGRRKVNEDRHVIGRSCAFLFNII